MSYTVEQNSDKRDEFGPYTYRIYRDGRLLARYWHDYRGDDHGLEFVGSSSKSSPTEKMTEFLEGGGPQPLKLSARAIAFLDAHAPC